jgi:hypothetical protein
MLRATPARIATKRQTLARCNKLRLHCRFRDSDLSECELAPEVADCLMPNPTATLSSDDDMFRFLMRLHQQIRRNS